MKPAHPLGRTLDAGRIAAEALPGIEAAPEGQPRAEALAATILTLFDDYYLRSRLIPSLAKMAFESRDWPRAVELSHERIAIFSISIQQGVDVLGLAIRAADRAGGFWPKVEAAFGRLVDRRYEADLALAYLAAVRRQVYHDSWLPVDYGIGKRRPGADHAFLRRIDAPGRMTPALIDAILDLPGLAAPWRDRAADARAAAERVNAELGLDADPRLSHVEMVEAGFYRNRGGYVVGAIHRRLPDGGTEVSPLALALLHAAEGLYVDAVILRETTLRHVFSSSLANFHVAVPEYHELVDFLFLLMPTRPRGLHYSTVGYNHVGKLAVMEQLRAEQAGGAGALGHAPGKRGSVAIAFTAPASQYVMKVIRDRPTASYKWEKFDGVEAVLNKYRQVHELNRSGSMLDNVMYSNVSLPAAMFEDELLDDLLADAAGTVSLWRDEVFFAHLIVQLKVVPVPLYLASCPRDVAELVVIRLGQCIRNNAASNVFNRDLDGRNYGVSSLRFVYLFDYDAVEALTDVKVRTNSDREAGEEDIPAWFFEEGPIFLPEELEEHLALPDRGLRRLFREAHGELLTVEYWTRMQRLIEEGRVPRVRTYPRSTELRPPVEVKRLLV